MAKLVFDGDCGHRLTVASGAAGQLAACPVCGRRSSAPEPAIRWTCVCGEELAAPENLAGAAVQCPACGAGQTVPRRLALKRRPQSEAAPPAPPAARRPESTAVPPRRGHDVECPACGYLSPPVLRRCPRCSAALRRGDRLTARLVRAAGAAALIVAGWLLAAHFSRVRDFARDLLGGGAAPAAAPAAPGDGPAAP